MAGEALTQDAIIGSLADGKAKSHKEVARQTGFTDPAVWSALMRLWKKGAILRTKEPIYEHERVFKGRGHLDKLTAASTARF